MVEAASHGRVHRTGLGPAFPSLLRVASAVVHGAYVLLTGGELEGEDVGPSRISLALGMTDRVRDPPLVLPVTGTPGLLRELAVAGPLVRAHKTVAVPRIDRRRRTWTTSRSRHCSARRLPTTTT
jgi:hypothetical protein